MDTIPNVGDLVLFDPVWAMNVYITAKKHQLGIVLNVQNRVGRAWTRYSILWDGQIVDYSARDGETIVLKKGGKNEL